MSRWTSAALKMPLSLTLMTLGGICRRELDRSVERDLKSAQIAIVDADDFARRIRSAMPSSRAIVDFDQRGHAEFARQFAKGAQLRRRREWRRSAGWHRRRCAAASSTWYSAIVKSLRMTGSEQAARAHSRSARAALEKVAIGQDRERRGSTALVLPGEFDRAKIFDQNASAGRSFLDFGNDGRAFGAQGGGKIAAVSARWIRRVRRSSESGIAAVRSSSCLRETIRARMSGAAGVKSHRISASRASGCAASRYCCRTRIP